MPPFTANETVQFINPDDIRTDDIRPPAPPTQTEERRPVIIEGEYVFSSFEYITCEFTRNMLRDACCVMNRNELWRPFRAALLSRGVGEYGFMFTTDPLYIRIQRLIASTPLGGSHSGFSMTFVMRNLEKIAILGEAEYRRQTISRSSPAN